MKKEFEQLKKEFEAKIKDIATLEHLEALRTEFLGRKGRMAVHMKDMAKLASAERKAAGALANEVKGAIETAFELKQDEVGKREAGDKLDREWIDVTSPGAWPAEGHLHPTSQAIAEITDIFARVGFTRVPVPEVDWDWYTFEGLNMPKDHPARDNWETFFVDAPSGLPHQQNLSGRKIQKAHDGRIVAIPHPSNAQVHGVEDLALPYRILYIGRSYRRQSDASHLPMHHQFEVMMVDEGVSVAHVKGLIEYFVRSYFGPKREVRLRPHHFRFTEPSFEVDISCDLCDGGRRGACRLCKGGWLELAGAGLTHPNVLRAGGIDPKKYSALAFAFGVERTYMMREGMKVDDIRILYKNDLRFVRQF